MPKISSISAIALTLLATLFQLLAAPFEITKTNVNRFSKSNDAYNWTTHTNTMHNGKFHFPLPNYGESSQIWTTSGTPESTFAVSHIPFHESARINDVASINGAIIVSTESERSGEKKLWLVKTETGETTLIQSIPSDNTTIKRLVPVGDKVYYLIDSSDKIELWVTNGSAKETKRLHTLGEEIASDNQLIPSGNGILFSATDGTWFTQGTIDSTTRISNLRYEIYFTDAGFATLGGRTFFFKTDYNLGGKVSIACFDPVSLELREVNSLNGANNYSGIKLLGSNLYFITSHSGKYQLWQSDGTRNGTTVLTEFRSFEHFPNLYISEGSLYYSTVDIDGSFSIYRHTTSGPIKITPSPFYIGSSLTHKDITYLTTFNDQKTKIYALTGDELKEVTDTRKFGNQGTIELLTSDNFFLYYVAMDQRGNLSYYSYNLEDDASHKLFHSLYNTQISIKGVVAGHAYANIPYTTQPYTHIKTDGSISGTSLINHNQVPTFPYSTLRYNYNFYTNYEGINYIEFYKTNDHQDIVATVPYDLICSGGTLTSEDLVYGLEKKNKCEIYRYSPDSNQLKLIAKVPIAMKVSDYDCGAKSVNGRVFFITPLDQLQHQLWSCSANGGDLVCHSKAQKNPTIPFYGDFLSVTYANGRWYFPAYTEEHGVEMWSTNGTLQGTHIVKDLVPGSRGSSPTSVHVSENKIFFIAGTTNINETDVYCLDVSMPLKVEILNASGNFDDFTANVPTQTLKITNCSEDPIEQIHLTFTTSDFSTESSSFSLKQGESKIVRINCTPASFGEVEDQLTISASGLNGTTIENLKGFYEPSMDQISINGRPFSDAPIAGRDGIRFRYTPPNGYTRDVTSINLFVNSVIVETAFVNGEMLWTPPSSGVKNIELVLELSNGSQTIITSEIEVYGIEQDGNLQGDFLGLLEHSDGNYSLQGRAQIHASESGAFSGNLMIGKNQIKLKGVFSQNGTFQKTYKLTSGSLHLTVSRYVDESSGILCEAFYTSSDQPTIVHRIQGRLKPTLPEEQWGNYQAYAHDYVHVFDRPTMNYSGWENMDGYSFGTMTIRNDLSCTLRGTLANGEKWTSSSKLTDGASYPLFMNGNKGSVASCDLRIGDTSRWGGEAAGKVRWYAPQIKRNNVQPQSAYIETDMAISAKVEPETNDDNIFAIGESTVYLVFNGNQITPTITTKNRFLPYSDEFNNKLNATISRKQGTIQGNASILSNEEVVEETFVGMYFPAANQFLGYSRSKYGYRYFECGP